MGLLYKRDIRNYINELSSIYNDADVKNYFFYLCSISFFVMIFNIKVILIMVIIIKEIGSIRKLDELGRIVIPKSVREMLNMEQGDNIEFFIDDNKVLLKKSNAIDANEEEIYKLLQLYYLKYYKSSAIVEKNKVIIEYGKDVDKIYDFINNKKMNSFNKKVVTKSNYLDKYYYVTCIKDKYHFIVYEDKMFNALDSEILNFIIDYINKLL